MKNILMDLDGTITNPKTGITKAIQYALKAESIIIDDLDTLCKYIGPPLKTTFKQSYGFDEVKANRALAKYREYYLEAGMYENEVYKGMEELLSKLKATGYKIIVATSKPEIIARGILEYFGLAQYFNNICGSNLDATRAEKEEVIRYALDKNRISDYSSVIMVGDRSYDIIGAKSVGLASVGVLYGFGSREELEEAGADRLSETVADLHKVIMEL